VRGIAVVVLLSAVLAVPGGAIAEVTNHNDYGDVGTVRSINSQIWHQLNETRKHTVDLEAEVARLQQQVAANATKIADREARVTELQAQNARLKNELANEPARTPALELGLLVVAATALALARRR
jgi:peptidoglycan hydrolase CwlO-like protein